MGRPGIAANASTAPPAIHNGRRLPKSCVADIGAQGTVEEARVTTMRAGDRHQQRGDHGHQSVADGEDRVGLQGVAERDRLAERRRSEKPAMMLMAVMRMVASESRWLKRAAPSMAP